MLLAPQRMLFRMEISYKVGVGLPAYEVIDRTYGKKSFTLDYMDRIDIKFEPGRETERFYWWIKTNPPAHWSVSEDGSFYLMRFQKMELSSTMRIDPQRYGTYRIWSVVDNWGSIVGGGPVPVDGGESPFPLVYGVWIL